MFENDYHEVVLPSEKHRGNRRVLLWVCIKGGATKRLSLQLWRVTVI